MGDPHIRDDVDRWLETVKLSGVFSDIKLGTLYSPFSNQTCSVQAIWDVCDVNTGKPTQVSLMSGLMDDVPREQWDTWLYETVLKPLVLHELQERFTVKGKHPIDPHPPRVVNGTFPLT